MRKKLALLGFALAALAAASTFTPASADPVSSACPPGTRRILCTERPGSLCCPNNALCFC